VGARLTMKMVNRRPNNEHLLVHINQQQPHSPRLPAVTIMMEDGAHLLVLDTLQNIPNPKLDLHINVVSSIFFLLGVVYKRLFTSCELFESSHRPSYIMTFLFQIHTSNNINSKME